MLTTKKKKKEEKKKDDKKDEKKEETSEEEIREESDTASMVLDFAALAGSDTPKVRATGIYGTINEDRCAEALYSLVILKETGKKETLEDIKDLESDIITVYDPIDFYVSTYGGSATDMFALYDTMRFVREDCDIKTYGLGKVMSAGVLLLAAGSKGQRRIGANCRVMIHGVMSGQQGHLQDLENEMEEAKFTQKQYVKALAKETNMTEKYIKKLMDKKINVYLDAEEAVDLGIADIII